jgi:hypothetical protein
MESLLRVGEKARGSCCITMGNVMMVSGGWTNGKDRAARYSGTAAFMRDSMCRIKCRVRVSMPGQTERSTKGSGITT